MSDKVNEKVNQCNIKMPNTLAATQSITFTTNNSETFLTDKSSSMDTSINNDPLQLAKSETTIENTDLLKNTMLVNTPYTETHELISIQETNREKSSSSLSHISDTSSDSNESEYNPSESNYDESSDSESKISVVIPQTSLVENTNVSKHYTLFNFFIHEIKKCCNFKQSFFSFFREMEIIILIF